jgi:hypothetical protein
VGGGSGDGSGIGQFHSQVLRAGNGRLKAVRGI